MCFSSLDVIIINNDEEDSTGRTNFTVVFRAGIGIEVTFRNELLQATTTAPPEFFVSSGNTNIYIANRGYSVQQRRTPNTVSHMT